MNNEGNNAVKSWLAGDLASALLKAIRQNAKQALQMLPCMWIYGPNLKADHFPTPPETYGHPCTQHNQS